MCQSNRFRTAKQSHQIQKNLLDGLILDLIVGFNVACIEGVTVGDLEGFSATK